VSFFASVALPRVQQNDPAGPQPQLLLMLQDDKVGYCNLDGSLKLRKRKRQPNDEPRPAKVCCCRRSMCRVELCAGAEGGCSGHRLACGRVQSVGRRCLPAVCVQLKGLTGESAASV
jgi:hypothetical protein